MNKMINDILDSSSGIKMRAKYISSHFPNDFILIEQIQNLKNIPFIEALYLYCNEIELPICLNFTCLNSTKFKSFKKGYSDFCCLKCANESGIAAIRSKVSYNKELAKSKYEKTLMDRYGVKNASQIKEVKEKVSNTKKEKYGDSKYNNREKNKQTVLSKYGVDNVSKSSIVKEKRNETFLNKFGGHPFIKLNEKIQETNLLRYGAKNPFSSIQIIDKLKNISKNKLKDRIKQKYGLDSDPIDVNRININCDKCKDTYQIDSFNLYQRIEKYKINPCTKCKPLNGWSVSAGELELLEYVKTLDPLACKYKNGSFEIDVYSEKFKIGIEYNGLYWHSNKPKNFHLDKTETAKSLGIQLIHIFEDEWIENKELVKSMLCNKLGLSSNIVYARKCLIKSITNKEANLFFELNHLQGSIKNSTLHYGLFYNNELLFCMSFGKTRFEKTGVLEIFRLATKIGYQVIGGASKTFKFFLKDTGCKNVVSYCNYRISTGGIYKALGFKEVSKSSPGFFWVNGGKRISRMSMQKSKLVKMGYDPNLTADEIALELGYSKIYDCGHLKFLFEL